MTMEQVLAEGQAVHRATRPPETRPPWLKTHHSRSPSWRAIEVHGIRAARSSCAAPSPPAPSTALGRSAPFVARRARAGGRRRRRHPQLRAHARVPRGGVLHARGSSRPQGLSGDDVSSPRRSATTRPRTSTRSPRRSRALGGTPVKAPKVDFGGAFASETSVPEARPDARGHRGERLQRRRADDPVGRRPRGRRRDRAGRGAPRGAHPPHAGQDARRRRRSTPRWTSTRCWTR